MVSIDNSTSPLSSASSRRSLPTPTRVRFDGARAGAVLWPLAFWCLLAAGWEVMARRLANPLVPHLADIASALVRLLSSGAFFVQTTLTLERVLFGFLAALAVSLAVGLAMGRSRAFRQFAGPAVVLGLTVPGLVWALLCVIWFGISFQTATIAVALSVTPPLTLAIEQAVRSVSADLVEVTACYDLSLFSRLRFLWLPTMLPFLLSGVRIGLSMAWKVIVLVEIFGLSSGVGYRLNVEFSSMNVAAVLAWTVGFTAIMAAIEYGILGVLERRLTRWRRVASV